eukprot:gi/632973105/ref/XP_007902988.1/ PREDICTED: EF-hand calcium-binding domain-containing protein 4A isoform X1 [Callorhinchus milii]
MASRRRTLASPWGVQDVGATGNAAAGANTESGNEARHQMLEKARELFQLCDKEGNGFITKRDMQRLQNELPLTPDQLEAVFDSLDQDRNGYLTPVEFSQGLGQYIGVEIVTERGSLENSSYEETFESDDLDMMDDEEEDRFCSMMQHLGASQVFKDQSEVRQLWTRLRRDRPELLANFEEFLSKVSFRILEFQQDRESIEQALKRRESDHDREVQGLYEEMEQQIKREKEKLLSQDMSKHSGWNHHLKRELKNKEQDLENIIQRHRKLENQIKDLNYEQAETRMQNEQLRHVNEDLQDQLDRSRQELEAAHTNLRILQEEIEHEHHQKARDVLKVSKNMQKEKESLLRQLELLREMNKKLRDERDAFEARKLMTPSKKVLLKRGSVIGDYLVEDKPVKRQLVAADLPLATSAELTSEPSKKNCKYGSDQPGEGAGGGRGPAGAQELRSGAGLAKDRGLPDEATSHCQTPGYGMSPFNSEEKEELQRPLTPRAQPVGTHAAVSEADHCSPDRIFKLVMVGNSGVGKSSFIHRFSHDRFHTEICATIGIDYQVKSLLVGRTQVALQLWDTAGQERFRSVTKQYFRKADGVLVMYDVTTESSFIAVRNWMISVQEGMDERAVICLLGNKVDTADCAARRVSNAEGQRLAKDYRAVFYECSARSGYNIMEPMMHVARLLTEQEDRRKETFLQLHNDYKEKRGCC